MEGCRKEDPPTKKILPVGIGVPVFLVDLGMSKDATEMVKAVGDCNVISFYYLLQERSYTVKKRNKTKQTVQFKLEDTIFFVRMLKGVCANCQ